MYRLITESFLGVQQEGNKLKIIPCIPKEWDYFKMHYRYKNTLYHIMVVQKNMAGENLVTLDEKEQTGGCITLADDGADHHIAVNLYTRKTSAVLAAIQ
jgi:cellobiose phosphorylase